MPPIPIDPLSGPSYCLAGQVVTMDSRDRVVVDGRVYVSGGAVVDVRAAGEPAPRGFEGPTFDTAGTIYPGLIELHNHLAYNVLPPWKVPKLYTNRGQWQGTEPYRKAISGPMTVLGKTAGPVPAVVRYVEAKCLLAGVTTSQGIRLNSAPGIETMYRGVVRNVEQTSDSQLPEAATRVDDVDAASGAAFLERLKASSCLLLHLAEGVDDTAREHFLALQVAPRQWAIRRSLAGIHCAALQLPDFARLARGRGSMVWSPLSNLLLYGKTADVGAARSAKVRIALGSDWSPSGSKNLLCELKIARLVARQSNWDISDRDLIAMATRDAADVVRWGRHLGVLERGKRADMLVLSGRSQDAHAQLLDAHEGDVALVVIGGVARYGRKPLMQQILGARDDTEPVVVAGSERLLFFTQPTADPVVGGLTLAGATERLVEAMSDLRGLAKKLENTPVTDALTAAASGEPVFFLSLDHDEPPGIAVRPHLPDATGQPTGLGAQDHVLAAAAATPLSQLLEPMNPDKLTSVDDTDYLPTLLGQANLPPAISAALPDLF